MPPVVDRSNARPPSASSAGLLCTLSANCSRSDAVLYRSLLADADATVKITMPTIHTLARIRSSRRASFSSSPVPA